MHLILKVMARSAGVHPVVREDILVLGQWVQHIPVGILTTYTM